MRENAEVSRTEIWHWIYYIRKRTLFKKHGTTGGLAGGRFRNAPKWHLSPSIGSY